MMNIWLFRFLGLHDRGQKQKTEEVAEYVRGKKSQFSNDMDKLHRQMKKVHQEAMKSKEHSERLVQMTGDITTKISIITDRRRLRNG